MTRLTVGRRSLLQPGPRRGWYRELRTVSATGQAIGGLQPAFSGPRGREAP